MTNLLRVQFLPFTFWHVPERELKAKPSDANIAYFLREVNERLRQAGGRKYVCYARATDESGQPVGAWQAVSDFMYIEREHCALGTFIYRN